MNMDDDDDASLGSRGSASSSSSSSSSASGNRRPAMCAYGFGKDEQRDLCPETLELLKANDPHLACLSVSWDEEWDSGDSDNSYEPRCLGLGFAHRVDWETAGPRLADNTSIKKLRIATFPPEEELLSERSKRGWAQFCAAVSGNRSIEHLRIHDITAVVAKTLFVNLSQLLEHNRKLLSLHVSYTLNSSARRSCKYSPAYEENVSVLAYALEKCAASSSLEEFSICQINEIGRPWGAPKHEDKANVCKLIAALGGHRHLTKLELDYCNIGKEGCKALGKLLQSEECIISELSLVDNRIHDKCIDALTKALVNNTTLKILNLRKNTSISPSGWQAFFVALQGSNLRLDRLDLGMNVIADAAMAAFAQWLEGQSNLTDLSLGWMEDVTPSGWLPVFRSLKNLPLLEKLYLGQNSSIDEDGVICLAAALPNSLRKLSISGNERHVSTSGWQSLSAILQNESMKLKELDVGFFGRKAELDFAAALSGNKTLERLTPCFRDDSLLSSLLCDTSSIDATFSSNHTLHDAAVCGAEPLCTYLRMNKNPNKSQVARQKILQHHFSGDNVGANFELFLEMATSELPHAMSWMGRDDAGFFLLHRLIRSMPLLVERKSTNVAGAKRAREE